MKRVVLSLSAIVLYHGGYYARLVRPTISNFFLLLLLRSRRINRMNKIYVFLSVNSSIRIFPLGGERVPFPTRTMFLRTNGGRGEGIFGIVVSPIVGRVQTWSFPTSPSLVSILYLHNTRKRHVKSPSPPCLDLTTTWRNHINQILAVVMLGKPDRAVEINYQRTLGTFEDERKLRGETVVPFLVTGTHRVLQFFTTSIPSYRYLLSY